MSDRPSRAESARLLRQQVELGTSEIFLDGLSRDEVLRLAREAAEAERVTTAAERVPATTSGEGVPQDRGSDGVPVLRPPGQRAKKPAADPPKASGPVVATSYEDLRTQAMGVHPLPARGWQEERSLLRRPVRRASDRGRGSPGGERRRVWCPLRRRCWEVLGPTPGDGRAVSPRLGLHLQRPQVSAARNRNPMPDEIEICSPLLLQQIDRVRPEALLAVGSFSAQLLTGREKTALGKLRGEVHSYHGVPLVVTYHPAALLRNSKWTRSFWSDLQLLRDVMADGPGRLTSERGPEAAASSSGVTISPPRAAALAADHAVLVVLLVLTGALRLLFPGDVSFIADEPLLIDRALDALDFGSVRIRWAPRHTRRDVRPGADLVLSGGVARVYGSTVGRVDQDHSVTLLTGWALSRLARSSPTLSAPLGAFAFLSPYLWFYAPRPVGQQPGHSAQCGVVLGLCRVPGNGPGARSGRGGTPRDARVHDAPHDRAPHWRRWAPLHRDPRQDGSLQSATGSERRTDRHGVRGAKTAFIFAIVNTRRNRPAAGPTDARQLVKTRAADAAARTNQ